MGRGRLSGDHYVLLDGREQKELFSTLIKTHSSKRLVGLLHISRGMIYHYRNLRTTWIPERIIQAINILENTTVPVVEKICYKALQEKSLRPGREIRHKKVKEAFKITVPLEEFIVTRGRKRYIDVEEWLEKTQWISRLQGQKGIIQDVSCTIHEEISVCFIVQTKRGRKQKTVQLPKRILLDEDFFYHLGLILGDGTGKTRVGVINKDIMLIKSTMKFLQEKLHQDDVKHLIYYFKKSTRETIKRTRKESQTIINRYMHAYSSKKCPGEYAYSIFTSNRILGRIIEHIEREFLTFMQHARKKERGAFLAGIFDAEGNINKLEGNFRISQKKQPFTAQLIELLNTKGYTTRYDGGNIILGPRKATKEADNERFEREIFPFLQSAIRRREAKDVLAGYLVREEYKAIVNLLKKRFLMTHKEIASSLNKSKCYAQLNALYKAGFIDKEGKFGETFKYAVTVPGRHWSESD